MDETENLTGQISVVHSSDGWLVMTYVGFFVCQEEAEAYAVEILEEHDGARLPAATVFH
jgi:hypothetical protein